MYPQDPESPFLFNTQLASKMTGLEEAVRDFIGLKYVEKRWFGPWDGPEMPRKPLKNIM
jgi:hypothetical protein